MECMENREQSEKALNGEDAYRKAEEALSHGADDSVLLKYYLQAAEQGYAIAQIECGLYYFLGRGTAENNEQAFHWFQMAADQGEGEGCRLLAYMYWNGYFVERDLEQTKICLQKAIDFGSRLAAEDMKELQKMMENEK